MTLVARPSLCAAFASLLAAFLAGGPARAQATSDVRGRLAPIGAAGTAQGWAVDRENQQRTLRVYFSVDAPLLDGQPLPSLSALPSVLASEQRPDVNQAEGVIEDHGFRFTIPDRYRDGRPHVLYAAARDPRTGRLIGLLGAPQHFHLLLRERPAIPERWFEDNNLQDEHGVPVDFVARYAPERLESWKRARETMDVYMLRSAIYSAHFLGNPELKARFAAAHAGRRLCLDDTSATWAHLRNPNPTYAGGLFVIGDLLRQGLNVESVALQSVLDKPPPGREVYPMAQRVRDIVEYVRLAKGRWPGLRVGLIDSLPAHGKDWRTAYLMVRNGLREAGLTLDFLLLDMPMQWVTAPGGWATFFSVQAYVRNVMGWQFGWNVTLGRDGASTLADYRTQLLAGLQAYQDRGGGADFLAVMSWSLQPELSAPDSISTERPTTLSLFREVDHRLPR